MSLTLAPSMTAVVISDVSDHRRGRRLGSKATSLPAARAVRRASMKAARAFGARMASVMPEK